MEVSDQLHAPIALPPGRKPPVTIGYEVGWSRSGHGGNESSHKISNGYGVRVLNFAKHERFVRSTMFPHYNIQTSAWISPDSVTHNQIDHMLVDRSRHSNIVDIRPSGGSYCDTII
jgi:hypothetical protein